MNLLLVTSSPFFSTYGGGQVYVKNIVDELIRQGISPVIATPAKSNDQIESFMGCTIYTFNSSLVQKDFKTLIPLLTTIKPDLVHAHGFKSSFAQACKDLNIPCIITAHHGGILCPAGALLNHRDEICRIKANPKDCLPCVLKNIRGGMFAWPLLKITPLSLRLQLGKLMNRLPFIFYFTPILTASVSIQKKAEEWKSIYSDASLLIAPSQAIADSMVRNSSLLNKITVVPHGIPPPKPSLLSEYSSIAREKNQPVKFFFVGRICHVKGVHVMLAAFNQLLTNAELHIIGGTENKTEEQYFKILKMKYIHNQRIIWHGKEDPMEVNRLIAQFDIMVHPTICLEVFGLNIAEALALGRPVIATRCGGSEMQIKDGVNGWLVEPNNTNSLAYVMEKISKQDQKMNLIAVNVTSIEIHLNRLLTIYSRYILKINELDSRS